ncbi:MAG: signal recognition particle-docking protein FtsY [candidate division WOR-3 bacterium]
MTFITRLSRILSKTRQIFIGVKDAQSSVDIENILLQADVGIRSTEYILKQLSSAKVERGNYQEAVAKILIEILSFNAGQPKVRYPEAVPAIIMIVGVPGSGKTTTIAKLANYWQKADKKVLISASDTYRAAAADQLSIWAERSGADIIYSQKGQDAGAVCYDAIQKAKANNYDIVLIDTAGRLHTRKDLMEETKKIKRVCQKIRTNAPDEIWLVLDGTIGQNSIIQAKTFHQELNLTGVIVTKLDGTAKGGIIIPVVLELKLPIKFLGIGEQLDDLIEFSAEDFVQTLLS